MTRSLKPFTKHLNFISFHKHPASYGFIASTSFTRLPRPTTYPRLCFSHFRPYSSSRSATFMEVFKAIAQQELAAHGSTAFRADQKSYSYKKLISSAQAYDVNP